MQIQKSPRSPPRGRAPDPASPKGGGRRSRGVARQKSRAGPIQDPLAEAWERAAGLPVGNPEKAVRALDEMHAAGVLPEDVRTAVAELNAKGKNRWTGIASIVRPALLARDARRARASPPGATPRGSPPPPAASAALPANLDADARADLQFVRYNPHAPGAEEARRRLLAKGVPPDEFRPPA